MFCCNNCEKSFKTNWQLQRHLSKKNTCKKKNQDSGTKSQDSEILSQDSEILSQDSELICKYCEKQFSLRRNAKRHEFNCKHRDDHVRKLELQLNICLPKGVAENACRFCKHVSKCKYDLPKHLKSCKAKEEYQKRLEAELQAKKAHNNNVTVINNNTNNSNNTVNNDNKTINNNINVHINPIGQENVSYMTFAVIKNLMRQSHSGEAFMANTLAYIHAHEDHPENHNIIVSNHRSNLALVKRSDKIEYENINTVMRET